MTDDDKDGDADGDDDARKDGGGDWKKAQGAIANPHCGVFCSLTPVYDAQRARFAARRDARSLPLSLSLPLLPLCFAISLFRRFCSLFPLSCCSLHSLSFALSPLQLFCSLFSSFFALSYPSLFALSSASFVLSVLPLCLLSLLAFVLLSLLIFCLLSLLPLFLLPVLRLFFVLCPPSFCALSSFKKFF